MAFSKRELINFFVENFDLESNGLDEDLPLFSSSLLDSTSMITLVAFLEQHTGITIEADDLTLENFDTVSSILSFCHARAS